MNQPGMALALVHSPVLDRRGDVITTAVTNLDLHDLARTALTYGVDRVYVVTPVAEQQRLAGRIIGHWSEGFGATYNPDRSQALKCLSVAETVDQALENFRSSVAGPVQPVLTAAGCRDGMRIATARQLLQNESLLVVLGTGWGLAPDFFERGWATLEAIRGPGPSNHLPVRAAAAIILDRLLGDRDC